MKKLLLISAILLIPISALAVITPPVSYWNFNEQSGTANDAAFTNNLTNTNTATFNAGKLNNGGNVASASSQVFSIADNASVSFTGDMSISLWYKPASAAAGAMIAKYSSVSAQRSYYFQFSSATSIIFDIVNSAGSDSPVTWTVSSLGNGTFAHLVVTYKASTHNCQLWINDVFQGAKDITNTDIRDGTAPFEIGGNSTQGFVNGEFDNVSVYNSTLSTTTIDSLYNGGNGIQYPFFNYSYFTNY